MARVCKFDVFIESSEDKLTATIFYNEGNGSKKVNTLDGQYVVDLYNAMTGEGLTLEDIQEVRHGK